MNPRTAPSVASASGAVGNVVPIRPRSTVASVDAPPLGGLSDAELAHVEHIAKQAADRLERAIAATYDLAKAARRFGSDRMADMAALLPLYDAAAEVQGRLTAIRTERSHRSIAAFNSRA